MQRHHSWSPFEDLPSPLSTDVEEIVTYMRHAAAPGPVLPDDVCIDLRDDAVCAESSCLPT